MAIAQNSKWKNRLEQLLYLHIEIKYLKEKGLTESLKKVQKEKALLEKYIKSIDDVVVRELLEEAYLNPNSTGVFKDDSLRGEKNGWLREHPLENLYDLEEVKVAKQILKKLVKQQKSKRGKQREIKELDNDRIEKYISVLDNSLCRMILRDYLICNESDRKIRTKVGYSENTSIFIPLKSYFRN
ncbi:hypothetical protein [Lysinibacillus fusiformis]|uniref:hypothetical protein n=1 Tax=Lysinibacillus fusiformis TaxID=28031 RepID=UPI003019EEBB